MKTLVTALVVTLVATSSFAATTISSPQQGISVTADNNFNNGMSVTVGNQTYDIVDHDYFDTVGGAEWQNAMSMGKAYDKGYNAGYSAGYDAAEADANVELQAASSNISTLQAQVADLQAQLAAAQAKLDGHSAGLNAISNMNWGYDKVAYLQHVDAANLNECTISTSIGSTSNVTGAAQMFWNLGFRDGAAWSVNKVNSYVQ